MSEAVLILGMHRSGTSYLANCLQQLGVHIGERLIGAQAGNPRGHYEAESVMEFHRAALLRRAAPTGWAFDDGMLSGPVVREWADAAERAAACALLEELRTENGLWGWKEPRTCLFLGAWAPLLGRHRRVVVYRHPLEVSASLLRRGHWDIALYPAQAHTAYARYNGEILETAGSAAAQYCFNANAGYAQLQRLGVELADWLGVKAVTLQDYHAEEFHGLAISRGVHAVYKRLQPEAAAAFESLERATRSGYRWAEREDEADWERWAMALDDLLAGSGPLERAALLPWLESALAGTASGAARYHEMADAIGARVRRVEAWNREAAHIHTENARMAAENERLGGLFAEQQAFLAEQAKMNEKLWSELSRTGKSWEAQRDRIEALLQERQALHRELDALKARLGMAEA